jgi:N-acetylglucosaminyldiphosphoundecaprenol N-acetyl-beta-D-mannosaminyltransferase
MITPFGITFSTCSLVELVEQCVHDAVPAGNGPRLVVTANLDHIVHLRRHAAFRDAYARAWVATADGTPVYLYARMRRCPLPERVSGASFFARLMPRLIPGRHRPFFVVSRPGTGERLRRVMEERGFEASAIVVECPPFGFERDEAYSKALAARIREHGTTHLALGVGAPKSEVWVDVHRQQLGDCYAFAVGAGVDFFVGVERRAPEWMQRAGLEWCWRFLREPRRLFRRYFVDSWEFLWAVKQDLLMPAPAAPVRRQL